MGRRKLLWEIPEKLTVSWKRSLVLGRRHFCVSYSVTDSEFPQDGSTNPRGGGTNYDFAKIFQKLHEIERIWTPGVRIQNFTM